MKDLIKKIIVENQQAQPVSGIERIHLHIPLKSGMIITITGARRSGKTHLLWQTINSINKLGILPEQRIFLNFEDERLTLKATDLDLILQSCYELYPEQNPSDFWFFFDEIQNIKGWEKFIRRIYDTISKNIYLTGSNSKMLASEIASELRGRAINFTLYPFSLREYLNFHHAPEKHITTIDRAKITTLAKSFIITGGFPEISKAPPELRIKILQEYFNVMIYRDIVERYEISNPETLKFFIKKALVSVTAPFSVNKTYNDLKSMGYKVSNKYLYDFLEHSTAAFLLETVDKFHFSEIKREKSDKKVYAIDHGLLGAINYSHSQNLGTLLENMVYLEFRKWGKSVYYFKDLHECDFMVAENDAIIPVQVSWTIQDPLTREREINGLLKACRFAGSNTGFIITFDETSHLEVNSISIRCTPVWEYFSNPDC
ncbi:MAG: ATP-binding protein [Bacteroidales bacterium]|nr:ATP-binding protein [Bacteroidales bacterium]